MVVWKIDFFELSLISWLTPSSIWPILSSVCNEAEFKEIYLPHEEFINFISQSKLIIKSMDIKDIIIYDQNTLNIISNGWK